MNEATRLPLTGALANVFDRVPFLKLLGARREVSEGGFARLALQVKPELTNLFEAAHGGVIMSLLDTAMASAAVSSVNFESSAVTLNLSVSFLQPGRGRLLIEGQRTGGGRSVCFCEGKVMDEQGQVLAHAVGSFKFKRLVLADAGMPAASD